MRKIYLQIPIYTYIPIQRICHHKHICLHNDTNYIDDSVLNKTRWLVVFALLPTRV